MKREWMMVLGVVLLAGQVSAEDTPVLNTMKDKVSYATGVDMVRSFLRQGIEVDQDLFLKGVKDGLSDGTLLLNDDDLKKTLNDFQTGQKMKLAERKKQYAEKLRKQRQNATKGAPGSPAPIATDNTRP